MTDEDEEGRWTEWTRLDNLATSDRNPRTHDLDAITAAIRQLGFVGEPRVDERTGRLVIGHGRTAALRREMHAGRKPPEGVRVEDDGMWSIPVARGWSSTDDAHAEAVIVADNSIAQTGGWDDGKLYDVLADLAGDSPDLFAATRFDSADLDRLLDREQAQAAPAPSLSPFSSPDPDPAPDRPRPPTGPLADWSDATPVSPEQRTQRPPTSDPDWPSWEPPIDPRTEQRPGGQTYTPPPARPDDLRTEHRNLPAREAEPPPGPLTGTEPAWRTLLPWDAWKHTGGEAGWAAAASWLGKRRQHISAEEYGDGTIDVWSLVLLREGHFPEVWEPGTWATVDGQTGELQLWTDEQFHARFIPGNEPARRRQRTAETTRVTHVAGQQEGTTDGEHEHEQ